MKKIYTKNLLLAILGLGITVAGCKKSKIDDGQAGKDAENLYNQQQEITKQTKLLGGKTYKLNAIQDRITGASLIGTAEFPYEVKDDIVVLETGGIAQWDFGTARIFPTFPTKRESDWGFNFKGDSLILNGIDETSYINYKDPKRPPVKYKYEGLDVINLKLSITVNGRVVDRTYKYQ